MREKPKGNAREMGELSAKREKCDRARAERGARGLPRERKFRESDFRRESVIE